MLIYFVLVVLILLFNYLRIKRRISEKLFYNLFCILMILVTGLRNPSVGADSYVYYEMFENARTESLISFLSEHRDIGFSLVSWIVMWLGGNFTVMALLVATLFYIPFFKLIERYSEDPGLSLLVLLGFTFFQFTMTGMRQTAALGFSFMFIYEVLNWKGRWVRAMLWVTIAYLFHNSAFVIILYPFIVALCNRGNRYIALYVLIPIFLLFKGTIVSVFMPVLEIEGFEFNLEERGGGVTTLLVYIGLFAYGYWVSKNKVSSISHFDMGLMALIVALQCLVSENSLFFRGVWYYSFYICIFIPKLVSATSIMNRHFIRTCIYAALLFMYFGMTIGSAHVMPYKFFWQ